MSAFRMTLALWAIACLAAPIAVAQTKLEPGLWRLNTTSTTNGAADPEQQEDVCLREDELKDLAKYFAPALEGIPAKCTTTRQPADRDTFKHRMHCKGSGFTMEVRSTVAITGPERFRMSARTDTRTPRESAVVLTEAHAVRTGACPQK